MSFIGVPYKKSSEVNLIKVLTKSIKSSEITESDIKEFNDLRSACISKGLLDAKNKASLKKLERYYDQLGDIMKKIPEAEILTSFKWKDAFDKGGGLFSYGGLSIYSWSYERNCILFNIGSMISHIASSTINQGDLSEVSLKTSAQYFQLASGIFQSLKHTIPAVNEELTNDLKPEVLSFLHVLMLAQAQEVFFLKAKNDKMKDSVIAQVANQCEEYYAAALKQFPNNKLGTYEKDWCSIIGMKQASFYGITEYHQSQICKVNKDFGEEISRGEKAVEWFGIAQNCGGSYFSAFRNFQARVERSLEEAKKDNDFIYHVKIPDYKSLPAIGKANLVTPSAIPEKFANSEPSPFSKLLDQGQQMQKVKFINLATSWKMKSIKCLLDAGHMLDGILASLNLPAAIEGTNEIGIPPSLVEKCMEMKNKGGIAELEKLVRNLPEQVKRNREILAATKKLIEDDKEADRILREKYKDKWTPDPTETLAQSFLIAFPKYEEILGNAESSDSTVTRNFYENKEMFELLCSGSWQSMKDALPKGSFGNSISESSDCVTRLRLLMDDVKSLKSERQSLVNEIKELDVSEVDITNHLKDSVDEFEFNPDVTFPQLAKKIKDCEAWHEKLIEQIRQENEKFLKEKGTMSDAENTRNDLLSKWAKAYNIWVEINSNLNEAGKFYGDLTTLLLNLQNKADDFCYARKVQREEIQAELSASQPQSSTTKPSAYNYSNSVYSTPPFSTIHQPSQQMQPSNQPQQPVFPQSTPYPTNQYQPYYYPIPTPPVSWNAYPLQPGYPPHPPPTQNYGYPYPNTSSPKSNTGYPYPN